MAIPNTSWYIHVPIILKAPDRLFRNSMQQSKRHLTFLIEDQNHHGFQTVTGVIFHTWHCIYFREKGWDSVGTHPSFGHNHNPVITNDMFEQELNCDQKQEHTILNDN